MEKNSRHDDEEQDDFNPPAIPMGPGGIPMNLVQPTPVPPRTEEHFVCLRGPCRHYWHLVTMAHEGNPADTWEHLGISAPRQHHHTCLVNPGYETPFANDNAYECSKWDPVEPRDLVQITKRRERYWDRANKELAEHFEPRPWWHRFIFFWRTNR